MTITTIMKRLRGVIRLILFTSITILLSPTGDIFTQIPQETAQWEIESSSTRIGDVFKATLVIVTQPGVTLDFTKLPDKGDILPLPAKIDESETEFRHYDMPPEIPEGEMEVVTRRINSYSENGHQVTEVDYELMYLLPLDLSSESDDKRLPSDTPIYQEYLQVNSKSGRVEKRSTRIFVDMADFYIISRIPANSYPIFKFFRLTPVIKLWPSAKLAGTTLLFLALFLLIIRGVKLAAKRKQPEQVTDNGPKADEMYQKWRETKDPDLFIEAVKLYRRGVWGRPQTTTWWTTTFILYSGIRLSQEETQAVFTRLVKEASDEPSP